MSLFRGILVVDQKQLKYGLTEGDLEDLQALHVLTYTHCTARVAVNECLVFHKKSSQIAYVYSQNVHFEFRHFQSTAKVFEDDFGSGAIAPTAAATARGRVDPVTDLPSIGKFIIFFTTAHRLAQVFFNIGR